MIGCCCCCCCSRSLLFKFRVDVTWKATNAYVIPKPLHYLQQKCYFYHCLKYNWKMHGAKDVQRVMDRKKRETITTTLRPFCKQSSSHEEYLVKDIKVANEYSPDLDYNEKPKVESQVEELKVQQFVSGCSSNVEHGDAAEVRNELDDPNFSSGSYKESDEPKSTVEHIPSLKKHSLSMLAGSSLMRFIEGKGGATQKKIEELGVKIILPSSKDEDYIIIEGSSAESVTKASEKVQAIIDEAVKSRTLDYSHFVSLPLAIHSELVDKLLNFQQSILGITDPKRDENTGNDSNGDPSDEEDKEQQLACACNVVVELNAEDNDRHVKVDISSIPLVGYPHKASKTSASRPKTTTLYEMSIEKSIFIKPKTFHLTVLMLKLWNKERVDAAKKVLQSISSKVVDALDGRPVSVRLKGLESMRGSFAKARVLYVPVEEVGSENRLVHACQVIIDAFIEAGLVLEKDAEQKLKLHATVMNTRHRRRKKWNKKFDSFDARGIVNRYGSEEWGVYHIREVHLSRRFAFDENGYYQCCTSVPFPESESM